ncbi:MAG: hypothetical protein IPL19_18715 [Sandaracinaceae bacterium]|nr:hypothetical protein [Sandaracinaceae bacterium]
MSARAAAAALGEIATLFFILLSSTGPGTWDQLRDPIHLHAPASEASMFSGADHFCQEASYSADKKAEEGHQAGHLSALRSVLGGLLADRFGALPPQMDARIDAIDSATLDQYVRRSITAEQMEDVFAAH